MTRIDLHEILQAKTPWLFTNYPPVFSKIIVKLIGKLLCINEMNSFLKDNNHLKGIVFVEALFDHLNFSYILSDKCKGKIPAEGKLVIVSNHPLGGLDGLALVKAVMEIRGDVRIVANDVLSSIENLKELFLPFDLYSTKSQKENIISIDKALQNDEAVILFPAGEVSRMSWTGIKDGKWKKGAVRFAVKNQASILPAFIQAKNSSLFYGLSMIWRNFCMFLLPSELFKKRNKTIAIKFGDPIPAVKFDNSMNAKIQLELLRKHVNRIGKGKKGIFATEKTIMHPVHVRLIKNELMNSELLGQTSDGKKIFVCKQENCPNVLKEIARLREITFRKVGEGTGKAYDTDIYDKHYHHIVLWDEDQLDIVGSYRLGITSEIIEYQGIEGLYNSSQFHISESFSKVLSQSIELGRSFIQQKYWGSNALDYIWQGIGAFVLKYPEIRFLWGAVSISNSYSEHAKAIIVSFNKKWYQGNSEFAVPIKPFLISKNLQHEMELFFDGDTEEQDFKKMKLTLKAIGFSIPVLYRRYTGLCVPGGANFISFSVDEAFMNAVDGLILLDLHQLRDEYKLRYYSQKIVEPTRN